VSFDSIHFRSQGVSLLLDLTENRLPAVAHWGADLGRIDARLAREIVAGAIPAHGNNTMDVPVRVAILPEHHAGWAGRPGLSGSRDGRDWSPKFTVETVEVTAGEPTIQDALLTLAHGAVRISAVDSIAQLSLQLDIEFSAQGILRAAATLTNNGDTYRLDDLALALPVPARAQEILDFAGRWARERAPQRSPLNVGTHLREGRRGRTGADAAYVLSVGEPGFGFAHGDVWGVHVAFSGNHRHYVERMSTGEKVVGGGELLLPGEVVLQPGESHRSPWLYAAYGSGLDDQARRFHAFLRARKQHPKSPRPVTLNVWEAVYFDHDLDRLLALADRAAEVGVERFVLDDGWFRGRRDEHAGLGDWVVDPDVWPNGLGPLVDRVASLGMEFGLWFEPEMVSPDSELARAHPDWIMQTGGRLPVESRNQQVLNLGIPAAFDEIRDQMVAILDAYDIAYIKWDHNRDLVDAGTAPDGRPGVHEQTLAAYRLMDELKQRFPALEIESCSSGGGRVDLAVLERTDRVWVSDCIDQLERQQMNRWTQQLIPLELMGSHIASGRSHSTERVHDLSFRAGTAMFGHLGIEWDLRKATPAELAELGQWVEFYKANRDLLHTGQIVRMDDVDPTVWINGVVAPDQRSAVFSLGFVGRSVAAPVGRFTLRGLNPDATYRVRPVVIGDIARADKYPFWFGPSLGGIELTGRALAHAGLQLPMSPPDRAWILEVRVAG
jgi:alpha-galactosidase